MAVPATFKHDNYFILDRDHNVSEREGSHVRIELHGEKWRCHRPHPGKEAKRYQVEEAR